MMVCTSAMTGSCFGVGAVSATGPWGVSTISAVRVHAAREHASANAAKLENRKAPVWSRRSLGGRWAVDMSGRWLHKGARLPHHTKVAGSEEMRDAESHAPANTRSPSMPLTCRAVSLRPRQALLADQTKLQKGNGSHGADGSRRSLVVHRRHHPARLVPDFGRAKLRGDPLPEALRVHPIVAPLYGLAENPESILLRDPCVQDLGDLEGLPAPRKGLGSAIGQNDFCRFFDDSPVDPPSA